jgi:dihydrofolate synthase/folylpolyglutamate synthase
MMRGPMTRRDRPTAAYLSSRVRLGVKFGLETMRSLVEALGHPERGYPVLLVAGTNGKGSVAAYVDSVLRAGGLRVGRYTSPHLVRVNERITVGGREIGARALDAAVSRVRAATQGLRAGAAPLEPTFFEVLTAAALLHFQSARVEAAVLEVGMGARLDATNVTEPLSSAIVTVDRDHEAYLGGTLSAIAHEKAGVLRRGRVTVLGPMAAEPRRVIAAEAAEIGARLADTSKDTEVRADARRPARIDLVTPVGIYRALRPLPGLHQRANLVVAVRLLEEARAAGLRVDLGAVAEGIARTRWPGRLQRLAGRPALLVDGAHNPAAARALAHELRRRAPFVLVFGAMADKDVGAMGRILFPLAREVVITQVSEPRAASPDEVARRVGRAAARARREPRVLSALAHARRLAGPRGLVVVAGSLYLAGDVLRAAAARRRGSRPRK